MARIAHLSDIHFGGENADAVDGARLWLAANPTDVTVISGDLTRFGAHEEFVAAANWVSRLSGPLLLTPGNHDTPWAGLWQRIVAPFAQFESLFGDARGAVWESADVALAAVNTARGVQIRLNWSKGEISRGQTDRAVAALAGRPTGALAAFVCHHPLVEMAGGPMTARVRGGAAAARRLCEAGADLVLTGHIHAPFAMALPFGDGLTYAVGASTLSVRERGAPAGFNLIELDAETLSITALAWSGSNFETWRQWRFPRRPPRT